MPSLWWIAFWIINGVMLLKIGLATIPDSFDPCTIIKYTEYPEYPWQEYYEESRAVKIVVTVKMHPWVKSAQLFHMQTKDILKIRDYYAVGKKLCCQVDHFGGSKIRDVSRYHYQDDQTFDYFVYREKDLGDDRVVLVILYAVLVNALFALCFLLLSNHDIAQEAAANKEKEKEKEKENKSE